MSHPWFTGASARPSRAPSYSRYQQHVTVTIPSSRPSRRRVQVRGSPYDICDKFDELTLVEEEEMIVNNAALYGDVKAEVTGVDVPPPVTSFSEMGFCSEALIDNIKRLKYVNPTPIQRYAIPVALAGRDLMACAQTGSGKTAAFCFPIISAILAHKQMRRFPGYGPNGVNLASPLALILAPTRELSCQIFEEAEKFSYQTGVRVVVVYGGSPISWQLRRLEKGVDILVATPGRLMDMVERSKVSLRNVKYLTLDEADRMLDMGFERDIRKIVLQMGMPPPGVRQTMLFSATFPEEIRRLGSDFLKNHVFLTVGKVGSSTNSIVQRVEFVRDMDKRDHLMNLLCSQKKENKLTPAKNALTLVFVETKRGADALEQWLCKNGFPSAAIHGDKVQMERERALRSFKNGRTPVLVATDVAARGLDIPDVAHVINFDLPKVIDSYVHRIGRTGRAGKSGLATAFFSDKNAPLAKELIELMREANQDIPEWLVHYEKTSYHGGGNNRYGNRKYNDHVYGRNSYAVCHNDDYSSQCGDKAAGYVPYVPKGDTGAYNDNYLDSADPFPQSPEADSLGAHSSAYNYGDVISTGWD
ncbi:DEAD-box ATP-dependent RNA helicase 52C-like [Dorcoceras hygrometricum]|uniref:RNA helicase n=1 Tax=Dorcoceras hygrometricum TaxID=472368 RepID=A0A2Z7ABA0_9LAMI|nr:DEAD-box ATP-dependent RNA helicase 52C-like [Dorcoceras hygrometricum]